MRNLVNKFLKQLFLFDIQETKGEKFFFRILEFFIAAFVLRYAWEWASYIPKLGGVILPLGIANYLDVSFMFSEMMAYLNAVTISVLLLLAFIWRVKYAYLGVILFFHLQYVSRFSQGEISHGSNMVGMCVFILAVAFIVFKKPELHRKLSLGLMYFYVGMSYTTAACSKLVSSGFSWVDGRHLWLWIGERSTDKLSQHGFFELNILQDYILEYHWLATLILAFGLLTELFGFLFWFRKPRPYIATFIIAMHLGIQYSMNITFSTYVYILILLGYPWASLLDKGIHWMEGKERFRKLQNILKS